MSDAVMHGQLRQINSVVNGIGHEVGRLQQAQVLLHQALDQVSDNQDVTRAELNELKKLFEDFLVRDQLANNLQLAQSQVIAVVQELDGSFGHHAEVRRLATGTLQGMDTGIVTQETVQATAEELMIITPRYWLAPALVALAAWIRDDRGLAEKALGEALLRDNDKTSLFFALVLRRQSRNHPAARWLRQYVTRQDPAALSREFTVVLDAAATGALGPDAKPMVMEHLSEWYDRQRADQTTVDAQVARWRALVDGMRHQVPPTFTVLPEISPTWPLLSELYAGATVHGNAEAHFRAIFDHPLRPDPVLQRRVDDILTTLVSAYDVEEAPLRERRAELDAIIAHDGDKNAARDDLDAAAPVHADTVDFLTLITNAGFFPQQVGASEGTQRLAIALAKDWIVEAAGQLEAANLQAVPSGVDLSTDGWTGRIDANASEEQLVASVDAHVRADTQTQLDAVRFTAGPYAIGAAAVMLLLTVLVAVGGSTGGAVVLLLLAVAAGGWTWYGYAQLEPRRRHIRALGEQRREAARAKVHGAVAEVIDWRDAWERELARCADLRRYLGALNRDAFVSGHHPAREVVV